MKFLKTGICWIIGIVAIVILSMWFIFGTIDFSKLGQDVVYKVEQSTTNGLEETGKNQFRATENDAWFSYELPEKGNVKEVDFFVINKDIQEKSQIYYTTAKDFNSSQYIEIELHEGWNTVIFENTPLVGKLRFDFTSQEGESYEIQDITVSVKNTKKYTFAVSIVFFSIIYIVVSFWLINRKLIYNAIKNSKSLSCKADLISQVWSLSISDFRGRFSGSYLGMFWGIIQPLSTILLFWFVFQVGFRSQPIEDAPFILWLSAGMIPWNYFYDAWYSGTNSFTAYSYIVKKVVFKIEVLPVVKAVSAAFLNIIFNVILILICTLYGFFPGIHIIDMIYFSICLGILTLGLTFITATLNVFIKDVGQFLGILLNFLMWMTPMMWQYTMIPEQFSWFYKLNPLHYIINGYRESIINGNWFFYEWKLMIWFWVFSLVILICGYKLMKRLKPHFADVL